MKKLFASYIALPWERRMILSAALIAGLVMLISFMKVSGSSVPTSTSPAPVDTHIPRGFVLVPIEVQNYEALDSILGRFGVVDLYQGTAQEGASQTLVARNVRILRAPQNPSHFAILIEERATARMLKNGSLFTVIVKRPEATGTEVVKTVNPQRRKIVYGGP